MMRVLVPFFFPTTIIHLAYFVSFCLCVYSCSGKLGRVAAGEGGGETLFTREHENKLVRLTDKRERESGRKN